MKLEIKNLSKSFQTPGQLLFGSKDRTRAVLDFSLTVESGESVGLVGESGSGKTTVAKMIAGFLKPDLGTILFDGQPSLQLKRQKRAHLVQMVFQDPFSSINPKLILNTQLKEALVVAGSPDPQKRAAELMTEVELSPDFLHRYPHQLSGGQRQRFAIARALAMGPQILIADEPLSSLDVTIQSQILALLNKLRIQNRYMQIVISHDLAVISNLCTRVVVVREGQVIESGLVENVLGRPQADYTRQLIHATPVL